MNKIFIIISLINTNLLKSNTLVTADIHSKKTKDITIYYMRHHSIKMYNLICNNYLELSIDRIYYIVEHIYSLIGNSYKNTYTNDNIFIYVSNGYCNLIKFDDSILQISTNIII